MSPDNRSDPPPVERRHAAVRQMLVQLPDGASAVNRRFRRRQGAITLIPLVVAGLLLTAGAVAASQVNVTNRNEVFCAARAEKDIWGTMPGTTAVEGVGTLGETPGGAVPIMDAVALCSDLWAQHVLDASTPNGTFVGPTDRSFSHPVPDLVECVMKNGAAAVIPGEPGACQLLGLDDSAK